MWHAFADFERLVGSQRQKISRYCKEILTFLPKYGVIEITIDCCFECLIDNIPSDTDIATMTYGSKVSYNWVLG